VNEEALAHWGGGGLLAPKQTNKHKVLRHRLDSCHSEDGPGVATNLIKVLFSVWDDKFIVYQSESWLLKEGPAAFVNYTGLKRGVIAYISCGN